MNKLLKLLGWFPRTAEVVGWLGVRDGAPSQTPDDPTAYCAEADIDPALILALREA